MNSALPSTDSEVEYFWKGVAKDELLLRRCVTCKVTQHPAQATAICPICHGAEFEQFPASGRGTVYTWIKSVHPTRPDDAPRIIAVIELEEGVRLVSNVIDADAETMRNDLPVTMCFVDQGGVKLPVFRPVRGEVG
ncbi:MAG TPA: OB-fold domain-containing protein [Pseudonocardiaceae bacterium]|jgi:hypothetical protein